MSLSRRRWRKEEQRRQHESRPGHRISPGEGERGGITARFSPERLFAQCAREDSEGAAPSESRADDAGDVAAAPAAAPSPELREARNVARLAYTRRQAAEALGVSISTIDRHVVPLLETVKLPWGQRLIPAEGIERLLHTYREPARGRPARRAAGRPQTLPQNVVERIRLEYARGQSLSEIARALSAEGVPTAHGGRKWWPSTVRAILAR